MTVDATTIVALFGGDHDLTLRSIDVAARLGVAHAHVVARMEELIDGGHLVGAKVTTLASVDGREVEARLAWGAPVAAKPAPSEPSATAPPKELDPERARHRIAQHLASVGILQSTENIARAVGLPAARTAYLLQSMLQFGTVERHGRGHGMRWCRPGLQGCTLAEVMGAAPKPEPKRSAPPPAGEDAVSTQRVAAAKSAALVVGLFSDGHLELANGAEHLRLAPDDTRILCDFLARFRSGDVEARP